MNIAFWHGWFPAGGAERVTIRLAESLPQYNFYVLSHRYLPEKMPVFPSNLSVLVLPKKHGKKFTDSIIEALRRCRADIFVLISSTMPGADRIRKETGCRILLACHGEPFWQKEWIIDRDKHRWWGKLVGSRAVDFIHRDLGLARRKSVSKTRHDFDVCDRYVCLCPEYCDILADGLGISRDDPKLSYIYNSQETVLNPNLDKDNIVLYCGRMDNPYKRVDYMLDVWREASGRLDGWKLLLAGDGPDLVWLKEYAERIGLQNYEFLGHCPDMQGLYSRASILCLTSQCEGWPLCLTEAQAQGVIPIAFDCTAGVKSILSPDGVNGFLVKCFDIKEYADTLVRVAEMPKEGQNTLRKNVIRKVSAFSVDSVALKWDELFKAMAARNA